MRSLPFTVRALSAGATTVDEQFREAVREGRFDYVVLFESSGMYRGEDVVGLAASLTSGRLDAVWGSRRLSVRDIEESYRFRYKQARVPWLGQLHGEPRAQPVMPRAVRSLHHRHAVGGARGPRVGCHRTGRASHSQASQRAPARAAPRRKADILEIPVQFLPISPDLVKRTSVVEGLQALGALVAGRFAPAPPPRPAAAPDVADEGRTTPVPTR